MRFDPKAESDFSDDERRIIADVRPYTRTGTARVHALIRAVKYVAQAGVDGAIVECGVWKGGSMMAAAKTLLGLGRQDRDLYLFDTFEGMPSPGGEDMDFTGASAAGRLATESPGEDDSVWCYAPLEEVRRTLASTGYDASRLHFVKGMVEETIPDQAPARIAILRLDTDWYESTKHELVHLFPRLASGGVLILDDYGHWLGARQAMDEYITETGTTIMLHRIDYSGRIGVKL